MKKGDLVRFYYHDGVDPPPFNFTERHGYLAIVDSEVTVHSNYIKFKYLATGTIGSWYCRCFPRSGKWEISGIGVGIEVVKEAGDEVQEG